MSGQLDQPSDDGWRDQFVQCVCPPGEPGLADATFAEVMSRYREPHRRYHGSDHVFSVLRRITEIASHEWPHLSSEGLREALTDVYLAAWYHDVVYDPKRADNEDRSANLAAQHLSRLGFTPIHIAKVVDLVMMTQGHRPVNEEQAIFADADLWTLGGSAEDYRRHGRLIREEFAHVSDINWIRGRSAAMATFLDRPTIFSTAFGLANREAQAQINVTNDVQTAARAPDPG